MLHNYFREIICAFAIFATSLASADAANACANAKINEFQPNPIGTDPPDTTIEILCADADKGRGSNFTGWIVSVESDKDAGQGTVDRVAQFSGKFDTNGLLVMTMEDLENPSFTVVLMESFTGTKGTTDIDGDNDGNVDDTSTFVNVYDAIGITDTASADEPLYGQQLGGIDLPFTGATEGKEPSLVYRDAVDIQVLYVVDDSATSVKKIDGGTVTDLAQADFVGQDPFQPTFGSVNPSSSIVAPTPSPLTSTSMKIHEIQGDSDSSPHVGKLVSVTAVVIGDFQDGDADEKRNLKGFFLQEEDVDIDADPRTSEGIYVYDPNTYIDVDVGDLVRVYGTVDEHYGETQIKEVTLVEVVSPNNPLPSAATITLPTSGITKNGNGAYQPDLEAYEGMLVKFTDTLTITEMYNLARFNEIKLVQGARPYTYTQKNAPSVAGYDAHIKELGARRITYDDGLSLQNKLICNLDGFGNLDGNGTCVSGGFNTDNSPRMGDTVVDLMGVLYYKWAGSTSSDATWRVTSIKDGTVNFVKTNPRPQIPPSVGGALTLVSANVLNFFLTLDDGYSTTQNGLEPRGANNQEEFDRQAKKLVNSIIALDPDVLGMLELENYFSQGSAFNALEFLVAELNKVAGAGYFAWVIPGQSYVDISDAISSGFLFKTSSIEWLGNVAVLRDEVLSSIGIDNSTAVFNGPNTNRASIAASFKPKGGACITVALNHLKSKGGSGTGDDADQIDGSGNWNAIRLKGAKAIHAWMESDPTGGGCLLKALMGDMNSYSMEDPIKYFESVGYTDVEKRFNGDDAYSYGFDGQIGTLDYILANAAFNNLVTGASSWHVNADEAAALDYNTDFGRDKMIFNADLTVRFSDHDPMVVGFDLEATTGSPVTNHPTTGTPISSAPTNHPTTGTPTTSTPISSAPTNHPTTGTPTTSSPISSPPTNNPTTGTPTSSSPISSPPTNNPTTGTPTSSSPISSPPTDNPTFKSSKQSKLAKATHAPVTHKPTVSKTSKHSNAD